MFWLASSIVALGACADEPNTDELLSGPIVVTQFDPRVSFGTFTTFAVNPNVSVVRDVGDAGILAPETAATLVESISSNMTARGYELVPVSARPSLGLQATVFLKVNVQTTTAVGNWWGLPGYAGAPAFWGYPGSGYFVPWSYSTQAYRTGTLIIECVDLRDAGAAANFDAGHDLDASITFQDAAVSSHLEIVWAAYAHAVTQQLLSSFSGDALTAIDQAFAQSPYLQRQESMP